MFRPSISFVFEFFGECIILAKRLDCTKGKRLYVVRCALCVELICALRVACARCVALF